jgi:hypothetical protein
MQAIENRSLLPIGIQGLGCKRSRVAMDHPEDVFFVEDALGELVLCLE